VQALPDAKIQVTYYDEVNDEHWEDTQDLEVPSEKLTGNAVVSQVSMTLDPPDKSTVIPCLRLLPPRPRGRCPVPW
jgi:hypothetical protein